MAEVVAVFADLLGSDLFLKGAGGAVFALHNAETWQWWHYVAWVLIILLGMEILSQLVLLFGKYVVEAVHVLLRCDLASIGSVTSHVQQAGDSFSLHFCRVLQSPYIPHRGKHLDELEPLDIAFITFNRCVQSVQLGYWVHASSIKVPSFFDSRNTVKLQLVSSRGLIRLPTIFLQSDYAPVYVPFAPLLLEFPCRRMGCRRHDVGKVCAVVGLL